MKIVNYEELLEKKRELSKKIPTLEELGCEVRYKMQNGKPVEVASPKLKNLARILDRHPKYKGRIWRDEFAHRTMMDDEEISDVILSRIAIEIDDMYRINFQPKVMFDGVNYVASMHGRNPLRELVLATPWNPSTEKSLLDSWLIDWFGVKDDQLHRTFSRKFAIGAIGRALYTTIDDPVKMDNMLIIYGEQGRGKSTGIEALAMKKRYFSDVALEMGSKEAFYAIQGIFLYELKELAKRSKDKQIEKAFIDTKADSVRRPFEKCATTIPRVTSFIGSTNRMDILSDSSGSRRFWCVVCCDGWERDEMVRVDEIRRKSLDLWREAAYYYKKGKAEKTPFLYWLSPQEERLREDHSEIFSRSHPWKRQIEEIIETIEKPDCFWFEYPEPESEYRQQRPATKIERLSNGTPIISPRLIMELMDFGINQQIPRARTTIEMIMMEMGYVSIRRRTGEGEKRITNWERRK